ncbi:MAG TPA: magnesium-translocating P-type ATPase [Burkholderiales bacterium]|nr:magnesium-translocating P-type ATPase [Burkholderiales bacterium]
MARATDDAWWLQTLPELCAGLQTDGRGLSARQAQARLRRFGPNALRPARRLPLLLQFLARFRNPLVLVLLVASAVAAAIGEVASFVIVSVLVVLSVALDFVQEHRAGRAAERLRQSVAVHCTAIRDGKPRDIPVSRIVPGDVVQVAAGDLIPADARVLEARDLFLRQAMLTGEPYPVEKRPLERAQGAQPESADNAVFMGTSVISGSGRLLVVRTGSRTLMGAIQGSLEHQPPPTAFEVGTRRFGLLILRMTVLLTLFVLLVNGMLGRPWLESFLFALALAVGLTPELLPMVLSVTLSHGAMRMARKRVIVRRLSAIQDLGAMDVLCTDKTGTLTEAKIRLERHEDALGRESERVLELAYLNSFFETGLRSPLDEAILAHSRIDVRAWRKIDEVPFDFERRRVSVLVGDGGHRLLVVKGAPEDVLRLSVTYERDGSQAPLDKSARARLDARLDALGDEGFRVLGIAIREVGPDHPHAVVDDETELTFCGFAAFLDPPKTSAGPAMAALAAVGVAVKIVTGDNERVTRHICRMLGIGVRGVLTGTQLSAMDDYALQAAAEDTDLFCRVSPGQKDRIIRALKARGHTVGYLGDGVNDAPPLHAADVGLSVDTAVDVAREAADIVLLGHDLDVLREGVLEGRRTFGNVMKYIMMGTSSNFGNMFSMAGASLFLPFLPMLPVQVLLNNLLYDLSELPIPMDRVDEAEVRAPRRWNVRFIRDFMWVAGPVSSLFDFLTFFVLLALFHADAAMFRTGWFVESLATQVLVIFVIRTRGSAWRSRPSGALVAASVAVAAVALLMPLFPFADEFGFRPLPLTYYGVLAALIATYLVLVEWVKRRFYRYHRAA